MKSLARYYQIQLILSSLLAVVILSLLFMVDIQLQGYARCMRDTARIFTGINQIFTTHSLDEETISLVVRYFPHSSLPLLAKSTDLPALQEEARRIARQIQELRNQRLEQLLQRFHLLMGITIPLFVALIFLIVLFWNSVRQLLRLAKEITHRYTTTYFLNMTPSPLLGQANIFHPLDSSLIPYTELQDFTSLFAQDQKLFFLVQELLSMDHSFSLEAFIDQFGAIVCSDIYQDLLPCDRFSLAVYDTTEDLLVAYHAHIRYNTPILLQKGFSQHLSETSLKKMIEQGVPFRIIHNLTDHPSRSAQLLLEEGIRSNLTIPIVINQRLFGFLFFAHRTPSIYTIEEGKLALLISNLVKTRLFYSYALQQTLSIFGNGIVNLVEFKDDETADHTRRVSLYTEVIATVLSEGGRITPQKAREITCYAPLHDIGKIGIPDYILQKSGKLTDEEWMIMRQHPWIGGKLIRAANQQLIDELGYGLLHTAYNLIVDHHEWWDGSGYPQRKKGREISIEGQIVAIADVFDALTTKRPYKEALPFEDSLTIIQEQAGSHFNPELVEIFISKRNQIAHIYNLHYARKNESPVGSFL
ncbi:MAG: HD domain-containing protein [Treponemataceae bacterium]|nr:HD domain-containing protein [Treponemataceae bacterium]